ncbi:hypothetical protein Y032_0032g2567 [Ancylostoma ceylanicum]|uniref:Uncharacterized protein n=1 Tax=Ancylostoma ceylanicum TaxID=53326 RepID=A0A016UPR8_9BILA|nr:hypothetical protein Y032_0032g2567 [Ancylostoma ceylanicum]
MSNVNRILLQDAAALSEILVGVLSSEGQGNERLTMNTWLNVSDATNSLRYGKEAELRGVEQIQKLDYATFILNEFLGATEYSTNFAVFLKT